MRAALIALVILPVALLAGCSGDGDQAAPPPGRALALSTALTPKAHLFGEVVQARLDVIVDRKRLDPDRIRPTLDFLPYRIQGGVRRSRDDFLHFSPVCAGMRPSGASRSRASPAASTASWATRRGGASGAPTASSRRASPTRSRRPAR